MPEEIVNYIITYGYFAIFLMVFLQEIGMPVPFPNELLLMFSGYLAYRGLLFSPFVILVAFSADFVGTNILYFLFYRTGSVIMNKKRKWFPISDRILENIRKKISDGGQVSIFIFRLTPFTRGYASVISGLLQIQPKVFVPIAVLSAMTWASFYVLLGYLLGPSWNLFISHTGNFNNVMFIVLITVLSIALITFLKGKRKSDNYKSIKPSETN